MDRMVSQARRLKRRLQIKWSRWSIFRYGLRGIFEKKKTEDLEPILKRDGELCSGLPKRVPRNTRMKGHGNCGEHVSSFRGVLPLRIVDHRGEDEHSYQQEDEEHQEFLD